MIWSILSGIFCGSTICMCGWMVRHRIITNKLVQVNRQLNKDIEKLENEYKILADEYKTEITGLDNLQRAFDLYIDLYEEKLEKFKRENDEHPFFGIYEIKDSATVNVVGRFNFYGKKAYRLIKTFDTDDADYNMGLARELVEKLEEKI